MRCMISILASPHLVSGLDQQLPHCKCAAISPRRCDNMFFAFFSTTVQRCGLPLRQRDRLSVAATSKNAKCPNTPPYLHLPDKHHAPLHHSLSNVVTTHTTLCWWYTDHANMVAHILMTCHSSHPSYIRHASPTSSDHHAHFMPILIHTHPPLFPFMLVHVCDHIYIILTSYIPFVSSHVHAMSSIHLLFCCFLVLQCTPNPYLISI
jgi:hypothetical protein